MEWHSSSIVLQLIEYMQDRGCEVNVDTASGIPVGLNFVYNHSEVSIFGEDIQTALDYAYRIEWQPHAVVKRFERYLISLNNKRKESYGVDN